MEIYGKDYGFMLTVDALCAIANECPNHDINRINEWLGSDMVSITNAMKVMAPAMSKGYCDVMSEIDPKFKGEPLTAKIIGMMPPQMLSELENEIVKAYQSGQQTTIETKTKKKQRAPGFT